MIAVVSSDKLLIFIMYKTTRLGMDIVRSIEISGSWSLDSS